MSSQSTGASSCMVLRSVLKEPKEVLDYMDHCIKHHGLEFTCKRLKTIHQAALKARSGDISAAELTLRSNRISVWKDTPYIPKGVFGPIVKKALLTTRKREFKALMAVTRLYTGLKLTKSTKSQVVKAKADITSPSKGMEGTIRRACDAVALRASKYLRCGDPKFLVPEYSLQDERLTSSYYCWPNKPREKVELNIPLGKGRTKMVTQYKPLESLIRSLCYNGVVPEALKALYPPHPLREVAESLQRGIFNDALGKIVFLQEEGGKARVVCAPNAWVQIMMRPLANYLDDITRTIEAHQRTWDNSPGFSCKYDQSIGAELLRQWLREGRECYSFDLSSATDRFPLEVQLACLEGLGIGETWGKALEQVAKAPYHCMETDEIWQYAVGQPMGLNCSMSLFHLTHFILLGYLATECHAGPGSFAVLGDDVIIADKTMAEAYNTYLTQMGVDITTVKSFEGCKVQQFAGFLAIKAAGDPLIFRPFKHGPQFSRKGRELALLHSVGWKSRKWDRLYEEYFRPYKETLDLRKPDLTPDPRILALFKSYDERAWEQQIPVDSPGVTYACAMFNAALGLGPVGSLPSMAEVYLDRVFSSLPRERSDAIVKALGDLFPGRTARLYGFVFSPEVYVKKTEDVEAAKPWKQYQIDLRRDPLIMKAKSNYIRVAQHGNLLSGAYNRCRTSIAETKRKLGLLPTKPEPRKGNRLPKPQMRVKSDDNQGPSKEGGWSFTR